MNDQAITKAATIASQLGLDGCLTLWQELRQIDGSGRVELRPDVVQQGNGVFWQVGKRPDVVFLFRPGRMLTALEKLRHTPPRYDEVYFEAMEVMGKEETIEWLTTSAD